MRYRLMNGIEIRTENAAKPAAQPSQFLLKIIKRTPQVACSFDYGCGKLRYSSAIANSTDTLAVVDSEIQLSRAQVLFGRKTSIRLEFNGSNRVSVYNNNEFSALDAKFDRGFCINVLSVIPSYARRRAVLNNIRDKLRREGECLFVVQYRNSDFTRMQQMPNARPWLDGFLIDSLRGYSFYGMIPPDRLERMLMRSGFFVRETMLNEGSAYVWAGLP